MTARLFKIPSTCAFRVGLGMSQLCWLEIFWIVHVMAFCSQSLRLYNSFCGAVAVRRVMQGSTQIYEEVFLYEHKLMSQDRPCIPVRNARRHNAGRSLRLADVDADVNILWCMLASAPSVHRMSLACMCVHYSIGKAFARGRMTSAVLNSYLTAASSVSILQAAQGQHALALTQHARFARGGWGHEPRAA